ncbi:MAG TPA: hypothetical protein DCR93_31495, partial [Cytophagales bacterium]|nr:hypothetical protein [Cytophagales bacterium]
MSTNYSPVKGLYGATEPAKYAVRIRSVGVLMFILVGTLANGQSSRTITIQQEPLAAAGLPSVFLQQASQPGFPWIGLLLLVLVAIIGYSVLRVRQLRTRQQTLETQVIEQTRQLNRAYNQASQQKEELSSIRDQLSQLADRFHMIHYIDRAIMSMNDSSIEATFRGTLTEVQTYLKARWVTIVLFDWEREVFYLFASTGSEMMPPPDLGFPLDTVEGLDLLRKHEPWQVDDIQTREALSPLDQRLTDLGLRSYRVQPLLAAGQLIGALTVAYPQPQPFVPLILEVLEEITPGLASSVVQIQLQRQLKQRNRDITASIEYAKNLQSWMLASDQQLKACLQDYFIFFQPRDGVSGDFYWMEVIDDTAYLAVADCTGHGVPGAMMSVMGSGALSKVIVDEGLTDTAEILDRTREIVVKRQSRNGKSATEAMDISLVAFNRTAQTLRWSGAFNPLWLVNPARKATR